MDISPLIFEFTRTLNTYGYEWISVQIYEAIKSSDRLPDQRGDFEGQIFLAVSILRRCALDPIRMWKEANELFFADQLKATEADRAVIIDADLGGAAFAEPIPGRDIELIQRRLEHLEAFLLSETAKIFAPRVNDDDERPSPKPPTGRGAR